MSDISKSTLGESGDADFEAKVAACTSAEEIKVLMANRSVAIGATRRDIFDPNVLLPVEPGTRPRGVAKAVVINGVKTVIEGATEQELLANENAFYRQQFQSADTATKHNDDPTRDSHGRFTTTTDDPTARIESDLVTRALESQGISPEALREFSNQREQQSWASAVEDFRAQHPDWVGGEENKNVIGNLIIENQDAFNGLSPLEALEKAYQHAVENGLLLETPESAARVRIANANSPEEIREALGRSSSSLFGR